MWENPKVSTQSTQNHKELVVRKTVDISDLITEVNQRNRVSTCDAKVRMGWNDLLETVLMRADRYRGFRYLNDGEVPPGQLAGIMRAEDPKDNLYPDETRREYL